jgi:hypothetical protein
MCPGELRRAKALYYGIGDMSIKSKHPCEMAGSPSLGLCGSSALAIEGKVAEETLI